VNYSKFFEELQGLFPEDSEKREDGEGEFSQCLPFLYQRFFNEVKQFSPVSLLFLHLLSDFSLFALGDTFP